MILQTLNELYDRLKQDFDYGIVEPGYSMQDITFAIVLNLDGSVVDIQDIRTTDSNGKKPKPIKMRVFGGNKPSGSGINSTFLWDTIPYLLGKDFKKAKTEKEKARNVERARDAHKNSGEIHKQEEQEINDPGFSAVCRFYDLWNPEELDSKYLFLQSLLGGYGVFKLLGDICYIHERKAIQDWYEQKNRAKDSDAVSGYSLISGANSSIARLHDKVKGIGAKAAALVSFNISPYESYAKTQNFNAPISEEEAFRYVTALNALTDGPMKMKHCVFLGDGDSRISVVFWAKKKDVFEDFFASLLSADSATSNDSEHNQPEQASESSISKNDAVAANNLHWIYQYLKTGVLPPALPEFNPETEFYVLGLSVNVTRVVIRFFIHSNIGEILKNFKHHYSDTELYSSKFMEDYIPSVKKILEQTCPKTNNFPDREKIPATLEGLLFRSIFLGTPYPASAYHRLLSRLKLDSDAKGDFIKTSFIKAYLIRNLGKDLSMELNCNLADKGYLCGRLFAIFEKTQRDALGDTGTTVRSSFMSSASSHPESVFPRLFKLYNNHLKKLSPRKCIWREKLVQEIISKIDGGFPATLDYTQQGMFFIGFYHQMQSFFTKKEQIDVAENEDISSRNSDNN